MIVEESSWHLYCWLWLNFCISNFGNILLVSNLCNSLVVFVCHVTKRFLLHCWKLVHPCCENKVFLFLNFIMKFCHVSFRPFLALQKAISTFWFDRAMANMQPWVEAPQQTRKESSFWLIRMTWKMLDFKRVTMMILTTTALVMPASVMQAWRKKFRKQP